MIRHPAGGDRLLVARRVAILLALVALLLGLGNRETPAPQRVPELDVIVAVDTTTSMSALDDPTGSRITGARRDLVELVGNLDRVRVSVLTFGTTSAVRLPITPDRDAFEEAVAALQVERPETGSGSSIGRAVDGLGTALDRAARTPGERIPVVVLVTDGENTVPGQQRSFETVGEQVEAAVVIGYGTDEGGMMPLEQVAVDEQPPSEADAGPLVIDANTGQPALSRRDSDNLLTISRELGAAYVEADGTQDMAQVAATLQSAAYADLEPGEPERELRWLWALLLLLLVLPELRLGWRRYLEVRREARG